MRGTFFRSDTRHPVNAPDEMFKNGFTKRDAAILNPQLRFPGGDTESPDIVPTSAVCFTRDFLAAPLFPVRDLTIDSWVFAVDLDVSAVYNTQEVQWEHVTKHKLLAGKSDAEAAEVLWTMFGQERATNEIEAKDIIGAVSVRRNFAPSMSIWNGGRFTCVEYKANPGYAGSVELANKTRSTMQDFVDKSSALTMPSRDKGIIASKPNVPT